MSRGTSAVVIGGGISGLATAALLARDGYSVTLLEKRENVGGRAGLSENSGFRFDTGPSWYLMPEVFDHFYRSLGTTAAEQLDLVRLDPAYRVFFEGRTDPVTVAASKEENVALFESIENGAGAKLERYLDSAAVTYEIAKKRFLYTTFESFLPLLRRDVLRRTKLLVRLLTESLDSFTSRFFRDERLKQILGYPAVFLGSSPFTTPSMYHLMSHLDLVDGVLYPRGGFTTIIDSIAALARSEGVDIRTNATVTSIDTAPTASARKPSVTGVTWTNATGDTQRLTADIVVSTADLHHSETQLLPRALQTYPEKYWRSKTAGPSAVLVSLGVRGTLPQLPHHSLFFTSDWKHNFEQIFTEPTSVPFPASLYVCKPSASDSSVAPEGTENLFILVPVPADVTIGGRADATVQAIADRALTQVAEWADVPDLAERIVVREVTGPADFASDLNAWKGTALGPAHILTQSAFFRAGNVSKKVDGLFYAGGSSIPGIGLPMCLISAELVIKRLRGDLSTEAMPTPLFPTQTVVPARDAGAAS
ncbi:phytoene desaturase family protein [Mycetocola zhadangensis]|uniref:Phytoene desaturase n=1 Tax=Mycetocola zhadangensis TaxID=1164595 RepID=A0A3L7J6C5_9MICO|nr:phytoene desaturase family protein [Mycetocola zhadangensis]RLQ86156.1 phytoene desaturase [Mycetocola zhadangensis]GGE88858.1 phytoene desaturase [Mycetocola zhadangensis]